MNTIAPTAVRTRPTATPVRPVSDRAHHDYWDHFYAGAVSADVPEEPSDFATWVARRLPAHQPIVEAGFGTARDALWLAGRGHPVLGLDFSENAVAHANDTARRRAVPALFDLLDLGDAAAVRAATRRLVRVRGPRAVYGRFLLHSLEGEGRAHFLGLARRLLLDGGELLLEFRTGLDVGGHHLFGDDHFRAYLDPDAVVAEIEALGGEVVAREEGRGLAVYRSEDPHVARLVATFAA